MLTPTHKEGPEDNAAAVPRRIVSALDQPGREEANSRRVQDGGDVHVPAGSASTDWENSEGMTALPSRAPSPSPGEIGNVRSPRPESGRGQARGLKEAERGDCVHWCCDSVCACLPSPSTFSLLNHTQTDHPLLPSHQSLVSATTAQPNHVHRNVRYGRIKRRPTRCPSCKPKVRPSRPRLVARLPRSLRSKLDGSLRTHRLLRR